MSSASSAAGAVGLCQCFLCWCAGCRCRCCCRGRRRGSCDCGCWLLFVRDSVCERERFGALVVAVVVVVNTVVQEYVGLMMTRNHDSVIFVRVS